MGGRILMTEELRGVLPGRFVPFLLPPRLPPGHQRLAVVGDFAARTRMDVAVLEELGQDGGGNEVVAYLDALKEMRDGRAAEGYGRPGAVI